MYQPRRAILNSGALFITDDMAVNPQRNSCVAVPQLPLHDGRSCAVREQSTGRTVTQRMEAAARDTETIQQPIQLLP